MKAETNPNVTPMMAQFLEIKERYPDALLFYRMGDFYELFFDDAKAAAGALDIALTKRGKHLGEDIAMCGVPHHAAEGYLLTLIRKGFKVAVCEQLEDPKEAKKRGAKSVVKRDVVRLVTPGTLSEDTLLNARQHNFLVAIAQVRGKTATAWCDMSTGDFLVSCIPDVMLTSVLARLAPREVLITDQDDTSLRDMIEEMGATATGLAKASFDSTSAEKRICELFKVSSLEAFGTFERAELGAMGAIVDYLALTQRGKLPLLRSPVRERHGGSMAIDAATRRNLELTKSLSGGRENTLFSTIDRTITGGGSRLLETRISNPSTDLEIIANRHDAVAHFVGSPDLHATVGAFLAETPDMERALGRVSLDRAGPRDLAALRDGVERAKALSEALGTTDLPPVLANAVTDLTGHDALHALLTSALVEEPPLLARDGGFVASGYNAELDDARKLRDEGRGVVANMQVEFTELTGITALKIKHNNVLGYFIETPATHAKKMLAEPLSETFIHRQTTANAVRFTTVELSSLESRIVNAGARALEIEKAVFADLCRAIMDTSAQVSQTAKAIAEIDVAAALAGLAASLEWVRPKVERGRRFRITGGRHPVVEAALAKEGSVQFIPNDCDLSAGGKDDFPVWLLTGPNMAGKSTFLRQNALIAVLAQIGSYVPATTAEIGIVDQLFSRVGAADDLARGRSTFMVEMVETAAILNQAGENALVILDEIGRGTATYDGLSIAWATLEHLHDGNKCRALFATHYHELTALSDRLPGLKNATVTVKEWEGEVVFLHQVKAGAADRSYGVQVARLAGLPDAVIARAKDILAALESGEQEGAVKPNAILDGLPLFSTQQVAPTSVAGPSKLDERIKDVLPDSLSPREALDLIYELKTLSEQ